MQHSWSLTILKDWFKLSIAFFRERGNLVYTIMAKEAGPEAGVFEECRILAKIDCTYCHGYTYLARRKHPKAVMAQRVVTTLALALTT